MKKLQITSTQIILQGEKGYCVRFRTIDKDTRKRYYFIRTYRVNPLFGSTHTLLMTMKHTGSLTLGEAQSVSKLNTLKSVEETASALWNDNLRTHRN